MHGQQNIKILKRVWIQMIVAVWREIVPLEVCIFFFNSAS